MPLSIIGEGTIDRSSFKISTYASVRIDSILTVAYPFVDNNAMYHLTHKQNLSIAFKFLLTVPFCVVT